MKTEMAIQFIDLLLSNKADVNAKSQKGFTPLAYIAAKGDSKVAKHLIANGAIVNAESVHAAATYQNNEYLSELLDDGGNPNKHKNLESSPLMSATLCCGDSWNDTALDKRIETIRILLDHGAKPSSELIQKIKSQEYLKPLLNILGE